MDNGRLIHDFTSGSVPKQLTRFMLPLMASNALQVLYSLVDMLIVGRFVGSAGLAGVSQGGLLMNVVATLCMGLCNSGQIAVSQLVGANRRREMSPVIGTALSVVLLFGVFVTAIFRIFPTQIITFLDVPPEAHDMALDYVNLCSLGIIFSCGYNAISGILRGIGDSKHPFVFIMVSSVLNLGLDYLLTGVLGYGVSGAATATVISQIAAFAMALALMYLHREEFSFDFRLKSFKIHPDYLAWLLKLGLPMALQAAAINISMLLVNIFINRVGVAASATFGVGLKIDDIANKLTMGIQYAAAPMVGQNYGAGNVKRVKSVIYWTWILSGGFSVLFVAAYISIGQEMFAMFTDDTAVWELAPVFISALLWSFPAMAIMRGTSSFFQGTGKTTIIMFLAFVDAGLRAVLSYLIGVAMGFGFFGFSLGFALAPYGVAIPGMLYFFFSKWKENADIGGGKAPRAIS